MEEFSAVPIHDRRELLEELLAFWDAGVIEDPEGGLHLTISEVSEVDRACESIPAEDVFAEASFLVCDLTDDGLMTFLSVPRHKLDELNVVRTQISGFSLKSLKNCPNLSRLNVQFGGAVREACDGIALCHNLEELTLDIRSASLDRELQELSRLKNLKVLEIQANKIGESIRFLSCLTALASLRLEAQDISDSDLSDIAGARNVAKLTIASEQVSDAGLANLLPLESLELLHLIGIAVGENGFSGLSEITNLEELWLEDISLTGSITRSLMPLSISCLRLSGSIKIGDDVVDALSQCASLQNLWITAAITDEQRSRLQGALPNCTI